MISRGQMYRQLYMGGGKGITSLDAGAPSIKYTGDIRPQMAMSAPDPMDALNDLAMELFGKSLDKLTPRERDALDEYNSSQMAQGGVMSLRQQYGLGSIVKKAVKGVTKAVKSVASSDLGKAALTAAAAYYAPALFGGTVGFGPTSTYGSFARGLMSPGLIGPMTKAGSLGRSISSALIPSTMSGKIGLGLTAIGGLTGYLASQGMDEQQIEEVKNRPEALKGYLAQYYSNLNPTASAEQVQNFVTSQLGEYAYAVGGRVGYSEGSSDDDDEMHEARELAKEEGITLNQALTRMLEERFGKDRSPIGRTKKAYGNTAQMASGIEGLPMRTNQAGVTELDLRKSGGFIPPVGIKEKADDIPAMLSNNEFVFTADAVRGMGDGDVNKGAQRLYDQMKMLEKGGRV
jgi:hypothetical protein